jgi:outer membrane protein
MKKRLLLVLLCILFEWGIGNPSVFSQEPPGEKIWTLEECIQKALKYRPELDISSLDIAQAEHQIKEAQSYYYPRLNMMAGYTHYNGDQIVSTDINVSALTKDVRDPLFILTGVKLPLVIHEDLPIGKRDWAAVNLDFEQPLYTFGRIDEGVKQARIGRSFAVNQKEKKKAEVAFEVKKAYYQLLAAKEMLGILKEAEAKGDVVSKMVKIAYEGAVPDEDGKGATRLDYLKARNFLSEVKARSGEMSKNVGLAELSLKMAVGLDLQSSLKISGSTLEGRSMGVGTLEELKEATLAKNFNLKSVDFGVQFFDSKRKSAKKEYLPKFGIRGEYIGPEDRYGNKNVMYGGVGLTMPLFDGFQTRAKVGQAEAQFEKVKGQKAILEKSLSAQVEYLKATLSELKDRARIVEEAVKDTQERISLASDGFAAGLVEYDQLLYAQRAELEARSIHVQTLLTYQITKSEVELVSGIE